MNPFHTTVAMAVKLAGRRKGISAPELAELAHVSPRVAQRTLALLTRDGVLTRTVPTRKGKKLGDWRIVYRTIKGGGRKGS